MFIESLLPVFPAGPVRTMSFGRFLWGKPLGMGSGAKESCCEEEMEGGLACRRLFVLLGCCMIVLGRMVCTGKTSPFALTLSKTGSGARYEHRAAGGIA